MLDVEIKKKNSKMINNKQCRAVASTTRVLILIYFFLFLLLHCVWILSVLYTYDPLDGTQPGGVLL